MSEFDDLEKKAEAFVEEHPEQADQPIDEAAGLPHYDLDHQHDVQIDRAMDAAEEKTDQDPGQGGQDQPEGNQA